jgi:hypothetical protein
MATRSPTGAERYFAERAKAPGFRAVYDLARHEIDQIDEQVRSQHLSDPAIVVMNPEDDTSVEALEAWMAALENDGDWIETETSTAELIAEDRVSDG